MHRYAALLRGIAPALPNMKNDQLRGVSEGLGYVQVSSVLASGNILFHSAETDVPALERTIQQALAKDLGIGGGTIIRERGELRALLDSEPFPGLTHGKGTYLIATFLKAGNEPPDELPEVPDPRTRIVRYDQAARASSSEPIMQVQV